MNLIEAIQQAKKFCSYEFVLRTGVKRGPETIRLEQCHGAWLLNGRETDDVPIHLLDKEWVIESINGTATKA